MTAELKHNEGLTVGQGDQDQDQDFVYEECSCCGSLMTDVERIWVNEDDQYICVDCKDEYGVLAKLCLELRY